MQRKKIGAVVSRINSVSRRFGEHYAFRKMLLTGREITSFENLRTVNGVVHQTFMGAVRAAGLIVDSDEWDLCLETAVSTGMPSAIQRLFAQIIMHCSPPDPMSLWN